MRNGRGLAAILFLLSLAFLLTPTFRWALEVALRDRQIASLAELDPTVERMHDQAVPAAELRSLAQKATAEHDAKALAFVALNLETRQGDPESKAVQQEAEQAADQAIALDPKLTWITMYMLDGRSRMAMRDDATVPRWLDRLEAFDPNNGAIHAVRADWAAAKNPALTRPRGKQEEWDFSQVTKQTEWIAAMEKTFASPQYHRYERDRFLLTRDVMRQIGRATPWKLMIVFGAQGTGNRLEVQDYARYKVSYLAEKAFERHQVAQGKQQLVETAAFGQRTMRGAEGMIDQYVGQAVDVMAAEGEAKLLRTQGNEQEAEKAAGRKAMYAESNKRLKDARQAVSENEYRDLRMMKVVSYALLGLAPLSLLLVLVTLLRGDERGGVDRGMRVLSLATSSLLLIGCALLFVTYQPYASAFNEYMTTSQPQLEDFSSEVAPQTFQLRTDWIYR
jgi:hypothetical protein